jgi:hypothetical protein
MTPRKGETNESPSFRARQHDYEINRRLKRASVPPRGPTGKRAEKPPVQLGPGMELKGQSILIDKRGQLRERWDKSHVASEKSRAKPVPPGHLVTKTTTLFGPNGDVRAQYVTAKPEQDRAWRALWDACREAAREYVGIAPPFGPIEGVLDDKLALYPLGDPHIGMLSWGLETGEDFDLKIATRELGECVRQLVASTPPARQAVLLNLGDMLHAQDDTQLTPGHGNKLDVDGRRAKVLTAAHILMRQLIDCMLQKHALVQVVNLPGNHDPLVAFEMTAWLSAVYERELAVTVADAFSPYWYMRFGKVLLGAVHGDGPKMDDLAGIMAVDRRRDWGEAEHCYWHVGHRHHKLAFEGAGAIVEVHNTLAARDAWSHGKGFRAKRELKSIVYGRLHGEEERHTVGIERVRAALESK